MMSHVLQLAAEPHGAQAAGLRPGIPGRVCRDGCRDLGTVAVVRAHLPWYATALACWGIAIVEVALFQLGMFLSRQAKATRGTR
jgi:hypothetical protein